MRGVDLRIVVCVLKIRSAAFDSTGAASAFRDTPWCNGNTAPFGGVIHGSNPCGVARVPELAAVRQKFAAVIGYPFETNERLGLDIAEPRFRNNCELDVFRKNGKTRECSNRFSLCFQPSASLRDAPLRNQLPHLKRLLETLPPSQRSTLPRQLMTRSTKLFSFHHLSAACSGAGRCASQKLILETTRRRSSVTFGA
jgi:hypothetical protein